MVAGRAENCFDTGNELLNSKHAYMKTASSLPPVALNPALAVVFCKPAMGGFDLAVGRRWIKPTHIATPGIGVKSVPGVQFNAGVGIMRTSSAGIVDWVATSNGSSSLPLRSTLYE